jgi:hypothetical protein
MGIEQTLDCVLASDYDALKADNDRLAGENKALKLKLGIAAEIIQCAMDYVDATSGGVSSERIGLIKSKLAALAVKP